MKNHIKKLLKKILKSFEKEGLFLDFDCSKINVDYPKNESFGDYSTNLAMILGKILKKNPLEIAEKIKEEFCRLDKKNFKKIEVVIPGYINFYLSEKYLQEKIQEINEKKEKYGESQIGKGVKINNEFISANPTGPLHLGNGRGGFLGDVISNVLEKCNFEVTREYYVNDAGEQLLKLGHSVLKDDEAVYQGAYIDELNQKISASKDVKKIGSEAAKIILNEIIKKTVKEEMKIKFDFWISERKDLFAKGKVDEAIEIFRKKKLTYEKEGALWLKTSQFGDDKDRVLIKKDGQKTYFASDCGYLLHKKKRGFSSLIEIWGADHHGYIGRFQAAALALGFAKGKVRFIIVQLVKLVKNGKEVRMSKRAGNVVYISELLEKVGLDAARFFFLMYSPDTHMNFDLGLAQEKSEKNPAYYVQYAHARISSIIRKKEKMDNKKSLEKKANLALLTNEKELNLMRELNKFPELLEEIAKNYETHKLPYYAIKLADRFHSFYNDCLVLDEKNPKLSSARLNLVNSARIVLAETLRILGVSAPEKM